MRFALFTLFLFIVFVPHSSIADQVSKYKPPTQFETTEDFFVIEGAGLLQSGSADAFNVDMWRGASREDITALIKSMPMHSKSPAVRDLIRRVLLSESNTEALDDYEDVTPGEDLLTLRIYKLMQGGFYAEALELYSVAIESPHHADIAKAGVLAMLGSGEKSIACLEMKTLGNMNASDPFWSDFIAYCNYTLSERREDDSQSILEGSQYSILRSLAFNPNFILPYSPDGFAALSLLERNLLIAEKRVEAPAMNDATLANIPPQDITTLLSLGTYNERDSLTLALKGARWGVVSPEALAQRYEDTKEPSILGGLPQLYQKLNEETSPETRQSLLIQALNLQSEYGAAALLPFAKDLVQWDGAPFDAEQMINVLRVVYLANVDIDVELIENYLQNFEEKPQNETLSRSLNLLKMMLKSSQVYDFGKIVQNLGIFHKNTQGDDVFVIENLDKDRSDVDNAAKVYEKDLDAALQKEHVVVANDLREELSRRSKAKSLGETVLLSIKMLRTYPDQTLEKDLYEDITGALENVELNKFSHKMAIERLIGD